MDLEFKAPQYFDFGSFDVDTHDGADDFFEITTVGMMTPAPRPRNGSSESSTSCYLPIPKMSEVKPIKAKHKQLGCGSEVPHVGRLKITNKTSSPHSLPKRRMLLQGPRANSTRSFKPIRMRRIIPSSSSSLEFKGLSHVKRNLVTSSARKKVRSPRYFTDGREAARNLMATSQVNDVNGNQSKFNRYITKNMIAASGSKPNVRDGCRRMKRSPKSTTVEVKRQEVPRRMLDRRNSTEAGLKSSNSLLPGNTKSNAFGITRTEPFKFVLDERLQSRNSKKGEAPAVENKNSTLGFKANESKIVKTPPFLPKKPPKVQISAVAPKLRLDRRVEERSKWDQQRMKKENERDELKKLEEISKAQEEAKEMNEYRKQLVHKPQPVIKSKFNLNLVKKPLTQPMSPAITKT